MDDQREDQRRSKRSRCDSAKERLWRQRLNEQEESALGVRAFCRREGFGEPRFYWWRREIDRRSARDTARGQHKKPAGSIADSRPCFAELLPARRSMTTRAATDRGDLPCAPRARRSGAFPLPGAPVSDASVSSSMDDLHAASLVPGNSSAIEIVLRGGRSLRVRAGFDPGLLLELAELLEGEARAC